MLARPSESRLKAHDCISTEAGRGTCCRATQDSGWLCHVPAVARDRVANVLLALRVKGGPSEGAHRAAQDIARQAARDLLGPLLDTACARLGSVLRRAFDIAADVQTLAAGGCAWALTSRQMCTP